MADHDSASITLLHQPQAKKAKTPCPAGAGIPAAARHHVNAGGAGARVGADPATTVTPLQEQTSSTRLTRSLGPPRETVTLQAVTPPSRRHAAPILLTLAALALAVVGMTMNGWCARSLGSTESAGLLFLAIGIAADLVALVIPSCAAGLWQVHQRATALAGWAVWALTFIFAITASIGFASVNIADVTASCASRITPAVVTAPTALADAVTARDRECRHGVGKFCRERELAVTERRQALDAAMRSEQAADPQTEASIRVVAWASLGALRPTENDFGMLRLLLLALLPQIGGVVLMIGRGLPARLIGEHRSMQREQKITIGEMRESGPTRLLVYCADYKCAHSMVVDASRWGDDVRLSDLEPKFTCKVCGHRGADIRPLFEHARMGTG